MDVEPEPDADPAGNQDATGAGDPYLDRPAYSDSGSNPDPDLARDRGPPVEEYAALAGDLSSRLDGEVRFDEYAQVLYATDGSIYQARPAGVVFPTDTEDVQAAVEIAANHDVPVLPRGAGSSLAGQAVGPGCVVLDLSRHMDGILSVDPDAKRATVQPGVVQDDLDAALAQFGLKFAPDPASSNRATIGGGIGNNSTGAHSVRYGITDAYTEELDVVLADGSLIHTREVVLDSRAWERLVAGDDLEARVYETVRRLVEENADEIEARYPDLKRCVSGYNLDRVVYENENGETVINLSKLFVGSEGTLGVVVRATLSLVSVPDETAVALYCYDDLVDAMAAVPEALTFDVSAVELMDAEVFRLARESDGYARYAEVIPDGTEAALMLEFDSERHDDLEAAVAATTQLFVESRRERGSERERERGRERERERGRERGRDRKPGFAFDVVEAFTDEQQEDIWTLRKAAIPLLMSLEGDPKPYPFIEDATVPPAELATYVREFQAVLEAHDTSAAYFAHAGSGTLHIRPILDLKREDDVEKLRAIADDVTDLVLDHHGAFSGEHGDGMARTEFNPKMYGPALWRAFKQLKTAFDPEWLLHPGNVVYRDGRDDVGPDSERGVGADVRENLRYGPAYQSLEPQTTLDFEDEGGFSHLVELCNGCGTCRQTGQDVMCPTYRASREEIQSTRGRANMLRAAISGEIPEETLYTDRFQSEVLDLCIGCKGCANDCPTGVDLAKLKAEVKHQYHDRTGIGPRERLFANVHRASAVGSALAPVSNWATSVPGSRWLLETALGIARERALPTFRRQTLVEWFDDRDGPQPPEDTDRKVRLYPDTVTNYSYPGAGKAAVGLLEAAGVRVELADVGPSGRAAYSLGLLDAARERAREAVTELAPRVEQGWDVVVVEPSDAVLFQDELLDFDLGTDAEQVAEYTYGVCEYIDAVGLDETLQFDTPDEHLTYHGHCHQKATNRDHHAVGVLRRAGYQVDPLDSACCGMAGSFGYEAEHYDLSQAIGEILFDQIAESPGDQVVAPGASCRTQLGDRAGHERPPHPVEKLAEAVAYRRHR